MVKQPSPAIVPLSGITYHVKWSFKGPLAGDGFFNISSYVVLEIRFLRISDIGQKFPEIVKVGKNLHTRLLHTTTTDFFLENNRRIFVSNIWWISPRTYYTYLLPHWRHN
jgi:hypothetical protein